ncbi:hypothetical protein L6452_33642 [Arctium lappa]|uniref:Uncharacterized protein n=1 Tax=Arctium lappa TaxID=4217 RepID=A0ACB8YG57_ARCLA|nr:hypothetical protein L6452_33642 [Arctium lappa]
MVEEVQKAVEEAKSAGDDKKQEPKESPVPPPIVLRVFMHCEGCAGKLRRCLKGFDGVDDVKTDWKTHTIVVKGEKADPLMVLERIQKKSHHQVELLSPVPKSPPEQPEKTKEVSKPEEKKEEAPPQVVTVVLKVHMHCEACAQGIRKRILKMNGVESAEADLKQSEVTVKGTFEPPQLAEYVNKKMGKQAVIVKQEPEPKKPEEANNNKAVDGGADEKKPKGEGAAKPVEPAAGGGAEDKKVVELRKNEFSFYQTNLPRYAVESAYGYPAAPQIFSDENPNACSVM